MCFSVFGFGAGMLHIRSPSSPELIELDGSLLAALPPTHMDRIVAFHPDDMDVVDLNNRIAHAGLFAPMDPFPTATVGGIVSTNCSDTNAFRHGTMKDWVLNLTVVLPDGTSSSSSRARPRGSGPVRSDVSRVSSSILLFFFPSASSSSSSSSCSRTTNVVPPPESLSLHHDEHPAGRRGIVVDRRGGVPCRGWPRWSSGVSKRERGLTPGVFASSVVGQRGRATAISTLPSCTTRGTGRQTAAVGRTVRRMMEKALEMDGTASGKRAIRIGREEGLKEELGEDGGWDQEDGGSEMDYESG
ncbi:hypothetical protein VTK26DRAFT_872 [Humicola hyalothermophila]